MTNPTMLAYEITLIPSHSTDGEYQRHANSLNPADGHDSAADILAQVDGDVYRLGTDDLPEGVEDIRGRIHAEPQQVYALVHDDGSVQYFGIDSLPVLCNDKGVGVEFV